MSGAPENPPIPIWYITHKDPDGNEDVTYWLSKEAAQRAACVSLLDTLRNSEWDEYGEQIEEILKLINRGDYEGALAKGAEVFDDEGNGESIAIESTTAADATNVPLWKTFSSFRKDFEEHQQNDDEDDEEEGDDGEAA